MLQFEELSQRLKALGPDLAEFIDAVGIERLKARLAELESKAQDGGFWDDLASSQVVLKEISGIKAKLDRYAKLQKDYEEAGLLIELADEAGDEAMFDECLAAVDAFAHTLEQQHLEVLLSGKYDSKNAIMTFHAGAGGTEAQDWAQMLYRMYTRYAERSGYKYRILDFLDGEEAGIKSASVLITGENAYGYLKSETGVHRLVRISPFDSSGRRHTSFASVEVMPEIDDEINIVIKDEDLRVDTYRSSGAGGQHVNKTESAIRITHIPSGIVVACQNERSQHQNREVAMSMLKSKLVEIAEREHLDNLDDIKGVQKEIAWGSQIRSYVFMPYTMVKDHRTDYEVGNINAVMDGEIDGFITAYLKMKAAEPKG